jgi:hypothetical protein
MVTQPSPSINLYAFDSIFDKALSARQRQDAEDDDDNDSHFLNAPPASSVVSSPNSGGVISNTV